MVAVASSLRSREAETMRANLFWLSDEQWRRRIEPHQPVFLAKAMPKGMRLTK